MKVLISILLAIVPALALADSAQIPAAIYTDPPADPIHPASTLPVEIPSHGFLMNGIVYRPSGVGPFPLVIFIHGLPGNEQSLDLAQAMRRAGWAVLTFHYRGAFGSEGTFSIDNVLEDADATMEQARTPIVAAAWNIDSSRIVVMGHSLGGLAAAHAARKSPDRLATVLIAPWDPSTLATMFRPLSPTQRDAAALDRWGDVTHGRLQGITSQQIGTLIVDHGEHWRLADTAQSLKLRPLLLITASRDQASSKAAGLRAALGSDSTLTTTELDTNHTFDDKRIGLQASILDWLARLQGAPRGP